MAKKSGQYLVFVLLLAGVSMLAAGARSARPPAPRRPGPPEQNADPYENRAVLAEAFVVQVDLSVLYDMDVNPLGQKPHSVSVENLLESLQTRGTAAVLTGAKATAVHGSNRNTTKATETTYHRKERIINTPSGQTEAVDYTPYEHGQTLSIAPAVLSNDTVVLNYSFSYSGARKPAQDSDGPRDTVSWSWDGVVSLEAGEPRIVGAAQDEKTAIFFILTAHILD